MKNSEKLKQLIKQLIKDNCETHQDCKKCQFGIKKRKTENCPVVELGGGVYEKRNKSL